MAFLEKVRVQIEKCNGHEVGEGVVQDPLNLVKARLSCVNTKDEASSTNESDDVVKIAVMVSCNGLLGA